MVLLSSAAGETRGGVVAGDVVVDERAGDVGLPRVDRLEDRAMLTAEAGARGIPALDALRARLDIGLDRGAEPGHGRRDDGVSGCLGEAQMELRVEREE